MKSTIPEADSFKNSNLIKLLSSFSKDEKVEFGKFVLSPLNPRKEAARFYGELKKYFPDFTGKDFSKENIYAQLYPGKKYRDDVIRKLSSNLFKLGEDYIVYRSIKNQSFSYDKAVLEYYMERFMGSLYTRQMKKMETNLENQKIKNANYFYMVNNLESIKRSYKTKDDTTRKKTDLQKEIDSMLHFSVISMLRLYGTALYDVNYFNKNYDTKAVEHFLKIMESPGFKSSKAAEINYLSLKLSTNGNNEETFHKLKALISENMQLLEKEDGLRIYLSLLSYCYDMNIMPGKDYYKTELEILQEMLKMKLLLINETIHSEWFMYVFMVAIRAGETVCAEKFAEKYKNSIIGPERENVLNHVQAELSFEKGDFKNALKYLSIPKYINVSEKLRANNLYLKIYYELEMSDPFFYSVDSFKHLLKNEPSLSGNNRLVRLNFVKYISMLYKIKIKESNISAAELKKQIMSAKINGNKWLLKKVNQLEKRDVK